MGDGANPPSGDENPPLPQTGSLHATPAPSPIPPDLTLEEAVHLFFADGYSYIENIFILFAASEAPAEVKDPILRVIARYLHVVKDAINHQLTLQAAHTCAVNAILGDPSVTKMVEDIMGQSVNQIVAKAVE